MERIGTLQGNDIILGKSPFSLRDGEISADYDANGKLVLKCVLGGEIVTLCREFFSFPYTMNTPFTIMGDLFGKVVVLGIAPHSLKSREILLEFDDELNVKLSEVVDGNIEILTPELGPNIPKWICLHTDGENSVKLDDSGSGLYLAELLYSYDKNTWNDWTDVTSPLLFGNTEGDLYIRGNNPNGFNWNYFIFSSDTDLVDISGNSMYLLASDGSITEVPEYGFAYLFAGSPLKTVSKDFLPSVSLNYECYYEMFESCTNLTDVPDLPATTLAPECYSMMYMGCSSLINVPNDYLPATTLAELCYALMFKNCTSLLYAPILPATTLAINCYIEMFWGCTVLNSVTSYATDISVVDEYGTSCLNYWLKDVLFTGILKVPGSMVDQYPSGASGIPEEWIYEPLD